MTHVLMIEDHADIRRLIRMTLELEDCQVEESNNGARGLEAAQRGRPDIVLLDVMMPGELDGLAVCRRIKADPTLQRTRVIMLSACGTAADIEKGRLAGADAYLVKPFSPLQLMRRVAELSPGGASTLPRAAGAGA
jgi:DNA-binding response OmpR family regulator